ncbi:ABC transporter permease, partial [Paracoccus haematequi]
PQRPSRPGPRFQMPRIIMALMLREMATTYGRSAGGYLWAILEPILGIALLSVIFSLTLARPGLGTNFPLFYASGLLPFLMFNDISGKVASAIRFSRPFLAYPSVTFVDILIARILLNALTHTAIMAIVLTSIVTIYQLPVVFDLSAIFKTLLCVTILATGVGTLNCYLSTAFPVWERIWSILTRPLFLMSGIFFLYGMMPPQAQNILWYNPLIHCIGMMRQGMYPTYQGDYLSPGYVIGVSVVLFVLGLMLLERNYKRLLER